MVMIDANVVLDVITQDQEWSNWSARQMKRARQEGVLAINPLIYAELANSFQSADDLDNYLDPDDYARLALPWNAAFLAGRAFKAYRQKGGNKTSPLPDFYIGAHALVEGLTLLTRDASRYKTYFPKLKLIAP